MAKVGLNFGEKIQIVDKSYRVLNDGLVDLKEIFGDLSFRSFEETDLIYEDDMTQPRRQDGSYPQIPTGESCRVHSVDTKSEIVKILHFKQFYKHYVFVEDGEGGRKKVLKNYIDVNVCIDMVCGDTKNALESEDY